MKMLNRATNLYLGDIQVEAVFLGSSKIWPPPPPVDSGLIIEDFDAVNREDQYSCFVTPIYTLRESANELDYGYYLLKSNVRSTTDIETSVNIVALSVTSNITHGVISNEVENTLFMATVTSEIKHDHDYTYFYITLDHDIQFTVEELGSSQLIQDKVNASTDVEYKDFNSYISIVYDSESSIEELVSVEQPLEQPVLHTKYTKTLISDAISLRPTRDYNITTEEIEIPLSPLHDLRSSLTYNNLSDVSLISMSRDLDIEIVESDNLRILELSGLASSVYHVADGTKILPVVSPVREYTPTIMQLDSMVQLNNPILTSSVAVHDAPIAFMSTSRTYVTKVLLK